AERVADDGTPLPDAPDRPAFASGRIDLEVPPVTRALDVTAAPADTELAPGEDTAVTVDVHDADGRPVEDAQVALVVVDEAVLALTGYELPDPLDVFYRDVPGAVWVERLRRTIVLDRPDLFAEGELAAPTAEADDAADGEAASDEAGLDADRADAAGGDDTDAAIDVRADLDALALYAPEETTDADGTVTVDVELPDNLTRYRVMAVAVDGVDRFGTAESAITARLPLMARPSAPRLLNLGDRFELPVVIQNTTDDPLEVDVVAEAANLELGDGGAGPAGRRVTVPAGDRVEVRFPAATDEVGTARVRVAVTSGDLADAAEVDIPVYTPATAEAFATYGVIDEGAVAQPLLAPEGVLPGFGGLEVDTSSTALQALTDAVLYLYDYPYDWADAYASRIIAVAALRDVLDAFDADGLPPPAELNELVADDIGRLAGLQNDDGGFPMWQRGRPSVPWVSIQATHALVAAGDAGYDVPAETLDRALTHLAEIERHFPADLPQRIRDTLTAYALHVRGLAGDRDTGAATELYRRAGDDLEIDALAWLWPLVDDTDAAEIGRTIANRAVETPGAATFATDYGEDAYLIAHSDRRTDGIVLDALLTQEPDSDLIP
ncbi:MAG: alpha-2-macroglobulin family protein, partial [Ilumatobacteraceae bacterium]